MLEEALNIANAQAVLTLPAKWHQEIKSKNIFPIEYAPHELDDRVGIDFGEVEGGEGVLAAQVSEAHGKAQERDAGRCSPRLDQVDEGIDVVGLVDDDDIGHGVITGAAGRPARSSAGRVPPSPA